MLSVRSKSLRGGTRDQTGTFYIRPEHVVSPTSSLRMEVDNPSEISVSANFNKVSRPNNRINIDIELPQKRTINNFLTHLLFTRITIVKCIQIFKSLCLRESVFVASQYRGP